MLYGTVSIDASVSSSFPDIFWCVSKANLSGLIPVSRDDGGGGPGGEGAWRFVDRILLRDLVRRGSPLNAKSLLRYDGIAECDLDSIIQWLRYLDIKYLECFLEGHGGGWIEWTTV